MADPSPPRRATCGLLLALCAALLLASCGGGGGGDGGDAITTTAPPTTATTAPRPEGPRTAPRWETVATFRGEGPLRSEPFQILDWSIQWRARWTCRAGSLEVRTDPPPRKGDPIVDASCPGEGSAFPIHTGSLRLDVAASGPWEVVVDQQIDTVLDEPPLPGMDGAVLVGEGTFTPVEMQGRGTARLYRLPDGRAAVRFEGFETSANTDLFVWLSEAADPRTSQEAVAAEYREIGNLKSTVGSQNYLVPTDLPVERVRSIVIWCAPVRIAYTAAPLTRAGR